MVVQMLSKWIFRVYLACITCTVMLQAHISRVKTIFSTNTRIWSARYHSVTYLNACSQHSPLMLSTCTCTLTLLADKGQGPGENVHEVGQPIRVRGAVELPDVHHVVLVLQHCRCWRETRNPHYINADVRHSCQSAENRLKDNAKSG